MDRYTLDQSTSILPLVKTIAQEFVERREQRRFLMRQRELLSNSTTPEGLKDSITELDAAIFEHSSGLTRANEELEELGLEVLRQQPLTIHFPGRTRTGNVVFCWQEGEDSLCHGHAVGEEEDPRRPLQVRIIDTHKT